VFIHVYPPLLKGSKWLFFQSLAFFWIIMIIPKVHVPIFYLSDQNCKAPYLTIHLWCYNDKVISCSKKSHKIFWEIYERIGQREEKNDR